MSCGSQATQKTWLSQQHMNNTCQESPKPRRRGGREKQTATATKSPKKFNRKSPKKKPKKPEKPKKQNPNKSQDKHRPRR